MSKPQDKTPAYWYGDAPPPLPARMLAGLYGWAIALRSKLFRAGLLRSRQVPVPVVVVGNISVGGTGKTPRRSAVVRGCVRIRDYNTARQFTHASCRSKIAISS